MTHKEDDKIDLSQYLVHNNLSLTSPPERNNTFIASMEPLETLEQEVSF